MRRSIPSSSKPPSAPNTTSASTVPSQGSPESFTALAKRNQAAEILQQYEKLSWLSFHRCESLNQTRQHFQNLAAGYTAEDEDAHVLWKEDLSPHPRKPGEDDRDARKGKARVRDGSMEQAAAAPSKAAPIDGEMSGDVARARTSPMGKGFEQRSEGGTAASASTSKKRKSGGGGS